MKCSDENAEKDWQKKKSTEYIGQYLVQVNQKYKAYFLAVRTGIWWYYKDE